jgi:hypothetical protein
MTNSKNDKALHEQGQVDTAKNLSPQYNKAKTQRKATPSTLMTIVDALENGKESIDVTIGTCRGACLCVFPGDNQVSEMRRPRTRLKIRLAFERAGYKPVSDKLLNEALEIAAIRTIGEGGWK